MGCEDVIGAFTKGVDEVFVHEPKRLPTDASRLTVALTVLRHRLVTGMPSSTISLENQLRVHDGCVNEAPRQVAGWQGVLSGSSESGQVNRLEEKTLELGLRRRLAPAVVQYRDDFGDSGLAPATDLTKPTVNVAKADQLADDAILHCRAESDSAHNRSQVNQCSCRFRDRVATHVGEVVGPNVDQLVVGHTGDDEV